MSKDLGGLNNPDNMDGNQETRVTIPEKKYIPKPEEAPDYKLEIPNFADNENTCEKTINYVKGYLREFRSRDAYDKFKKNIDTADEMWRAAKNRLQLNSDESSNVKPTGSNVKSASFYSDIRAITAGENTVIQGNEEEVPVEYSPLAGAFGALEAEGRRVTAGKNAYLSYVWEQDKMRPKIKKILHRTNKYGNQPIMVEWDYRVSRKKIKIPFERVLPADVMLSKNPAKGKDMVFVERLMIIADHPTVRVLDVRNFWRDSSIEEIQDQSCIVARTQVQLSEIFGKQQSGQYKNADKITTALLYSDEGEDNILSDRQQNAGEAGDAGDVTNLFDEWYGYVRIPVNTETGNWDAKKELATWFKYVMIGDIEGKVVCTAIEPHFDDEIPVEEVHCIDDDKGAIHLSYSELVKSFIAEELTTTDQYIDNKTKIINAPWIMTRGAIELRDMQFTNGGNQVFIKRAGMPDPTELDVKDVTGTSIQMLEHIDGKRRKALGTNKPFMGEPLGSRTSASEAITDFEQAIKPALDDAKYKSNQFLPFIAKWIDRYRELFADPAATMQITYEGEQVEIKPALLWGPMKYRVVSVKKFQDNVIRERMETQFMTQFFALAMQTPGFQGEIPLKQIAKNRSYENVDSWWVKGAEYDAIKNAKLENEAIIWYGEKDLPQPDEKHAVHLQSHEPYLRSIDMLEEGDKAGAIGMDFMKLHIEQHKQMQAQAASGSQAGGPPQAESVGAEGGEARTPGEVVGDELGAAENAGAGRPPEIEGAGLLTQ